MSSKKHTTGFDIPSDYFESFEARLEVRLLEEALPKSSGFAVPEHYFEGLETRIHKDIDDVTVKYLQQQGIRRLFWYVGGAAAALALLFTLALPFIQDGSGLNNDQKIAIDQYIEDGNLDFDTFDMTVLMNDVDLTEMETAPSLFRSSSLEEYLMDTIDDPSLIITE